MNWLIEMTIYYWLAFGSLLRWIWVRGKSTPEIELVVQHDDNMKFEDEAIIVSR